VLETPQWGIEKKNTRITFLSKKNWETSFYFSRGKFLLLGLLLFFGGMVHAGGADRAAFLSSKEEIHQLAVERIRSVASDYERVIVAAEGRLRSLHENYAVKGATPPTNLENDLGSLRGACQKMQRLVALGRAPDPDDDARERVARQWTLYREQIKALVRGVNDKKREGVVESQLYWETLRTFKDLCGQTETRLLFNTPPGERGLKEAFLRDEVVLLKACETTPKKTRGRDLSVVAPQEHAGTGKPDVQVFYRSLDLVPSSPPLRSGSFSIPPGSRTVTLREDGARLVFRPKRGKGIAYTGQTEAALHYGYLAIPPDTAYYFENTGTEPLELEYVGLKP